MIKTIMAIAGSVIVFFCEIFGIGAGEEKETVNDKEVITVSVVIQFEIEYD